MAESELTGLVDRTGGLQPGRRAFHALTGTLVALALTWLQAPRSVVMAILALIVVLLVVFDVLRLTMPAVNVFFFKAFPNWASPREASRPASSTWYALGLLLTVVAFPRPEAVTGILVMAWADPLASYIGRRWGTHPFLGGSVEGSLVFFVVAATVGTARHGLLVGTVVGGVGALVERRSWPLDDNLAVPLLTAGAATLLAGTP